jgi:hypothetical protein
MEKSYKDYCIENVKRMLDDDKKVNGNMLQIYRFLINNPEFIESQDKFRVTTIDKAKEVLPELENLINENQIGSIKRIRFENIKKILQDYLSKFDKSEN